MLSVVLPLLSESPPSQPTIDPYLSHAVWWSQTIELQDSKQSVYLKHKTNHSDYFDKYLKFNLDGVAVDSILPRIDSIICMKPLLVYALTSTPTPYFANQPSIENE